MAGMTSIFVSFLLLVSGLLMQGLHLNIFIQPTALFGIVGLTGMLTGLRSFRSKRITFHRVSEDALISSGILVSLGMVYVFSHLLQSEELGAGVAFAFTAVLYGFLFVLWVGLPVEAASLKLSPSRINWPFLGKLFVGLVLVAIIFCGISLSLGGSLFRSIAANLLFVFAGPIAITGWIWPNLDSPRCYPIYVRASLGGGVLGFIVGLIHCMGNLSEFKMLWTGLATSITPLLYAAVMVGVLSTLYTHRKAIDLSILKTVMHSGFSVLSLSFIFCITIYSLSIDGDFKKAAFDVICTQPVPDLSQISTVDEHYSAFTRLTPRERYCLRNRNQMSGY